MIMMMGRTLMKTWRHAGAAPIPGSWIQVDLGTSLACSHLPQSENEDHEKWLGSVLSMIKKELLLEMTGSLQQL